MKPLNAHGQWTLDFKNRILLTKVSGTTNKEASQQWLVGTKELVQLSENRYDIPWVVLNDARDWEMAALDSWEATNEVIDWLSDNNCILFAIVFSKKIHKFALEMGLKHQGIVVLFDDYDNAYQACLNSLEK
ncbi:hypothetical protein L4C34_12115 [Vibrio profundum]|uniref:hypothetical protein n=1 Tax=Vibrio profundum TaxID=2910247 RepID=UPI003D0DF85E